MCLPAHIRVIPPPPSSPPSSEHAREAAGGPRDQGRGWKYAGGRRCHATLMPSTPACPPSPLDHAFCASCHRRHLLPAPTLPLLHPGARVPVPQALYNTRAFTHFLPALACSLRGRLRPAPPRDDRVIMTLPSLHSTASDTEHLRRACQARRQSPKRLRRGRHDFPACTPPLPPLHRSPQSPMSVPNFRQVTPQAKVHTSSL